MTSMKESLFYLLDVIFTPAISTVRGLGEHWVVCIRKHYVAKPL